MVQDSENVGALLKSIEDLSVKEQLAIVSAVGTQLPREQQKIAAKSILPPPTKVNGLYWLVLGTVCVCLMLCVARLVGFHILLLPAGSHGLFDRFADDDKIIGMFTTILSFLLGLFVPSPVSGPASAD